jgi:hypothetical protein
MDEENEGDSCPLARRRSRRAARLKTLTSPVHASMDEENEGDSCPLARRPGRRAARLKTPTNPITEGELG